MTAASLFGLWRSGTRERHVGSGPPGRSSEARPTRPLPAQLP